MSKRKPEPFDMVAALKAREEIEFVGDSNYFVDELCHYRILPS